MAGETTASPGADGQGFEPLERAPEGSILTAFRVMNDPGSDVDRYKMHDPIPNGEVVEQGLFDGLQLSALIARLADGYEDLLTHSDGMACPEGRRQRVLWEELRAMELDPGKIKLRGELIGDLSRISGSDKITALEELSAVALEVMNAISGRLDYWYSVDRFKAGWVQNIGDSMQEYRRQYEFLSGEDSKELFLKLEKAAAFLPDSGYAKELRGLISKALTGWMRFAEGLKSHESEFKVWCDAMEVYLDGLYGKAGRGTNKLDIVFTGLKRDLAAMPCLAAVRKDDSDFEDGFNRYWQEITFEGRGADVQTLRQALIALRRAICLAEIVVKNDLKPMDVADQTRLELRGALNPPLTFRREWVAGNPGETDRLQPVEVVPVDIALGPENGLSVVVTGEHAAGKTKLGITVLLNALLAQIMAHGMVESGKFSPRMRIAIFDPPPIDHNDVELSRGQKEIRAFLAWVSDLPEGSLVLLDEVLANTERVQADCILAALLEHWHEVGTMAILTIHSETMTKLAQAGSARGVTFVRTDPNRRFGFVDGAARPDVLEFARREGGLPERIAARAEELLSVVRG